MKKSGGFLAVVLLLLVVSFGSNGVTAASGVIQFTVTGVNGPQAGVKSLGTFAFDPTIAPEGGGFVEIAGLFTHLAFSWDGVDYNEDTANTGTLGFDADGKLVYALFGTDCGPDGYGCGVGSDPQPKQWSFNYYDDGFGTITGAFYYLSPTDPPDIYLGDVTMTPVATPTDKNQCKKGGWMAYSGPNGPFKNQGDCIQFVNTGK